MKRLFLIMLLLPVLAWSQSLEVIKLRHRSAEQLLPQVAPFVEPGGALSGMNDTIFLRASPRNQAEIRDLLAALDTPPRRLMISVRQEGSDSNAQSGAGVSGRVITGPGGTAVSGRGHLYQSDSSGRRDIAQQVQTLDGGRASIMVGQSLQIPLRQRVFTPAGVLVSDTLVQYDIGTGFIAVPQLNGERVTVTVSPRDDTLGAQRGTINSQQLLTTVSGRLGEWLELGGTETRTSGAGSGIASYGSQAASRQRRLFLKVEELP